MRPEADLLPGSLFRHALRLFGALGVASVEAAELGNQDPERKGHREGQEFQAVRHMGQFAPDRIAILLLLALLVLTSGVLLWVAHRTCVCAARQLAGTYPPLTSPTICPPRPGSRCFGLVAMR